MLEASGEMTACEHALRHQVPAHSDLRRRFVIPKNEFVIIDRRAVSKKVTRRNGDGPL
jgi:hypothetical protein